MTKHPKHTRGPWEIDRRFWVNNGRIWGSDGMAVCFVEDRGGETMDNAYIIAAAPELLEALKICLGWLSGGLDGDWKDVDPCDVARGAIAKAEGKEVA